MKSLSLLLVCAVASADVAAPTTSLSEDVSFRTVVSKQILCHGIQLQGWLVLNWHCIQDIKAAAPEAVEVLKGDLALVVDPEIFKSAVPSVLKVAESAGLDFTLIPAPFKSIPADLPRLLRDSSSGITPEITLRQNGKVLTSCTIDSVCGSSITYHCASPTQPGWSGSSVWTKESGASRLIALHRAGTAGDPAGSARLISAILGRSSVLADSAKSFSGLFARSLPMRFTRRAIPPNYCPAVAKDMSVTPFISVGSRNINGMALFGKESVLTTDIQRGEICRYVWPSARAVACWPNPDPKRIRVNSLLQVATGAYALIKSNGDGGNGDGSISFMGVDPVGNVTSFDKEQIPAPVGRAIGITKVGSDFVVSGSSGLCVFSYTNIDKGCVDLRSALPRSVKKDTWLVTGVLRLTDNSFLSVGRDHPQKGIAVPVCRWFSKVDGLWNRTNVCKTQSLYNEIASFAVNGRELQFKAPVLLGTTTLVFGSNGAAYEASPGRELRRVSITGIVDSDGRLEDAVRDAKAIDNTHIALAASDGAFRILSFKKGIGKTHSQLIAYDIGQTILTAFDLGVWTTQVVVGDKFALVRTNDGSVYSVTWKQLPSN